MANENKDELRKHLQEVQQKIRELKFTKGGIPVDKQYANSLSAKELDLIIKVYADA